MPRIALDGQNNYINTSLIFGASGAGKTDLAASMEKLAWFGSMREGGYRTIQNMDRSRWWDPKTPPRVYAVETHGELLQLFNKEVVPLIQRGEVLSVCAELSFYTEDIIRNAPPDEKNGWKKYQQLEDHIIWLDRRLKLLARQFPRLRVMYNTLAADPTDPKSPGGIVLAGRQLPKKLPAAVDLCGYLRTEDMGGGRVDRVLHLTTYGNYMARHRYGTRLPPSVRNPTFRSLEQLLAGALETDAQGNVVPRGTAAKVIPIQQAAGAGSLPPLGGDELPPLDELGSGEELPPLE